MKVPASINNLESITCILIQILYVYGNLRGGWRQGCVSRKRLDRFMAKYIEKDKKALKRWVQISSLLFETAHNAQSIWSVHVSANPFFKFSVPCWANRKLWNWHLFRLISLQCYKCLNCFCFKSTFLLKFYNMTAPKNFCT